MRPNPDILREATRLDQLGLLELPLKPLEKTPLIKRWQLQTENRIADWFFETENNLGLRTGTILAADFESKEAGREFFEKHPTSTIVETRRGVHLYYRTPDVEIGNRVKASIDGVIGDVRGHGGYVVAPPSRVPGHQYRYVPGFELQDPMKLEVFDERWLPKESGTIPVTAGEGMARILRAQKYIARIQSIEGQGGDKACFRACCKLRDFGLSESEAWPLLVIWNQQNAFPPWDEKKLRHDLTGAYNRSPR